MHIFDIIHMITIFRIVFWFQSRQDGTLEGLASASSTGWLLQLQYPSPRKSIYLTTNGNNLCHDSMRIKLTKTKIMFNIHKVFLIIVNPVKETHTQVNTAHKNSVDH